MEDKRDWMTHRGPFQPLPFCDSDSGTSKLQLTISSLTEKEVEKNTLQTSGIENSECCSGF